MVGGCVEDEAVGVLELHTCYHAAHLLASREHVDLFLHFFLLEEHTSQIAFHHHLVACAVLAEPLHEVHVALEELGVVERQVGRSDGYAPLEGAGIGLAVAVDNLEQGGHGFRVV